LDFCCKNTHFFLNKLQPLGKKSTSFNAIPIYGYGAETHSAFWWYDCRYILPPHSIFPDDSVKKIILGENKKYIAAIFNILDDNKKYGDENISLRETV